MPKYKCIAKGFDGNRIIEPGEIFDYDGKPGPWMELVGSKGKNKKDLDKDETETPALPMDSDESPI